MKIQVDGIPELVERLGEVVSGDRLGRALGKSGQLVRDRARADCPVRTGHLRRSITVKVEGDSVQVGTPVEYASYVEYGTGRRGDPSVPHTDKPYWTYYSEEQGHFVRTSGQPPQPYLVPALKNSVNEIAEIFKEEIDG